MNSFESIFFKKVVSRLSEDRRELLEGLLNRLSHEDYLNRIGLIQGYNHALGIVEDVYNELNSPEK